MESFEVYLRVGPVRFSRPVREGDPEQLKPVGGGKCNSVLFVKVIFVYLLEVDRPVQSDSDAMLDHQLCLIVARRSG